MSSAAEGRTEEAMNFRRELRRALIDPILGRKKAIMPVEIPPVPPGIVDPNDLCNGVYNEDPELESLAWSNRRLQASLAYVLRSSKGEIREGGWGSALNKTGVPGGADLRTSTFARIWAGNVYHDADVRNIYRTPMSVVFALWELANPGKPMPQIQPFIFEAEDAPESPIGPPLNPNPSPHRRLYSVKAGDKTEVGKTFEALDGRYLKVMLSIPGAGPFGVGGRNEPAWEKIYDRAA